MTEAPKIVQWVIFPIFLLILPLALYWGWQDGIPRQVTMRVWQDARRLRQWTD